MNLFPILIIALFLAAPLNLHAGDKGGKETGGKKELKWLAFDAGRAEAAKTKKKMLVDLYTDWCKWCKVMDTVTYVNPEVVAYLNKNFVMVKVNAESSTKLTFNGKEMSEIAFAQSVGISGYPATLFFNTKGEYITPVEGYLTVDRFLPILKFIGENHYEKMTWDEFQALPAKKEVTKKK